VIAETGGSTFDEQQGGGDGVGDLVAGDTLVMAPVVLGKVQYRQVAAVVVHRATRWKRAVALRTYSITYSHFSRCYSVRTAAAAAAAAAEVRRVRR